MATENVSFAGKWDVPIFPICSNFCTNCIFRNHSYTLSNIFSYSLQIGLQVQLGRIPFSGKSFIEIFKSKKIFFFAVYIIVGWIRVPFLYCGFYLTCETNLKSYLLKFTQSLLFVVIVNSYCSFKVTVFEVCGSVSGESV
jgi:hypothetical protein